VVEYSGNLFEKIMSWLLFPKRQTDLSNLTISSKSLTGKEGASRVNRTLAILAV
jgi:hypothetical protein